MEEGVIYFGSKSDVIYHDHYGMRILKKREK